MRRRILHEPGQVHQPGRGDRPRHPHPRQRHHHGQGWQEELLHRRMDMILNNFRQILDPKMPLVAVAYADDDEVAGIASLKEDNKALKPRNRCNHFMEL